jgi:hypothetical protein
VIYFVYKVNKKDKILDLKAISENFIFNKLEQANKCVCFRPDKVCLNRRKH